MDIVDDSFFLDALSDDVAQSPAWNSTTELCDAEQRDAEQRDAEPRGQSQTPDQPQTDEALLRAMFTFVVGDRRCSAFRGLGVLNEHPKALKKITSNQCFSTSAFLDPVLRIVMAELWPSMMVQITVRLTAISIRLADETLSIPRQDEGDGAGEQQKLSASVRDRLNEALPYYQWQGPRNYYGRVQYLMVLLEETIRVLGVPMEVLTAALEADETANRAFQRIARCILSFDGSPADVCGVWAADTLLSAWLLREDISKSPDNRDVAVQREDLGVTNVESDHQRAAVEARQPPQILTSNSMKVKEKAPSPDSESEDELPPPSVFIRSNPDANTFRNASSVVKLGSRADDPMCIPDSEADEELLPSPKPSLGRSTPKASRYSSRGEALKEVNYSTRHHPQDEDLPAVGRRRKLTHFEDKDADARAPLVKRCKTTK